MLIVGLGGNLGGEPAIVERFRFARAALATFAGDPEPRAAPLFRTQPLGASDLQPEFLNSAVAVRLVDVGPEEVIANVLEIEHSLGRDRRGELRWGSRAIDLDVVLWDERTIHTPALVVPHPRLAQRRFVLEPLAALLGLEFVVPALGGLGELLERVRDQGVVQIAERW